MSKKSESESKGILHKIGETIGDALTKSCGDPPPGRRVALYVLASGPRMGATVPVFPMNGVVNEADEPVYADLAFIETPDVRCQTRSRYSKGKEPGTWHWA